MTTKIVQQWNKVKLGDFANILPGFAFKSSQFKKDNGIPVIKIKNITDDYGVSLDGAYLDGGVLNKKTRKFLIEYGDILVAMTGATAGKVGKFKSRQKALLNQRVAKVSPKNIDPDYLWVLLGNKDTVGMLYRLADGAAQPNMSGGQIENIEFIIPASKQEQKIIAGKIVAYDDLIENNTRRIQVLEQMAQAIYTEHFATIEEIMVEKKKLPIGWKAENLYNVADIKMGYAFHANQFNKGQKGLRTVRIRDIPSGVAATYTTEEVDSSYHVKKGDFLIGMDGIFHMNHWQDEDALLVQRVCRIRPKNEKMKAYLALSLVKPIKHFEATLMGATVAHLGSRHLKEVFIAIPDSSFDQKLEYLNMLLDTKLQYSYQNQTLRKTRDLLLPKLVTGEIVVK
ncbi:MAG: restriction endonuclease subunit S [Planctomycetes bacterium]|nr:restriction endonuclease subunit S [Planctomycetota bacterium]